MSNAIQKYKERKKDGDRVWVGCIIGWSGSLFAVLLYEERPKLWERQRQAKNSLRHTYTINIKVFTKDKLRILKKIGERARKTKS